MLEISDSATEQITLYFKDKEISPIRIFLNNGGCGGPSLAMALDAPTEKDEKIVVNGFTFIIEKIFLQQIQPIHIDFSPCGFKIDCAVDFGGSCGSSCSSGSCCGS